MGPPFSLDWYLGYLHCMVAAPDVPEWQGVLITERVEHGEAGRVLAVGPLQRADDFAPRFADLVRSGWPWVNLHALGILDGQLVVSVEVPAAAPTGAHPTSVNMSGFSNHVRQRGYRLDAVVGDPDESS